METEKQRIIAIFDYIKTNMRSDVQAIVVFGEIFGGNYSYSSKDGAASDEKEEKIDEKLEREYKRLSFKIQRIQKGYGFLSHFPPSSLPKKLTKTKKRGIVFAIPSFLSFRYSSLMSSKRKRSRNGSDAS